MNYEPEKLAVFLDDVIAWSENHYLDLEGRRAAPSAQQWTEEFVRFLLSNIDGFLACLKHPKFEAEKEWRLFTCYRPDDPTRLIFRQRQSMMSRHLPLRLEGKLPIAGVLIGPSRFPLLSRIAVSDLLNDHGYDMTAVKVDVSKIPYRIT